VRASLEPPRCDEKQAAAAPGTADGLQLWQALLALNGATLIWGSQHAVIKEVVEVATPASLNAARFSLAAVASLPWLPGAPWRPRSAVVGAAERSLRTRLTWAAGMELGAFSFVGFALQAVGLQFTTASRSAFLLYLNVKLVPVLALLVYGRSSPARTWASAAVALCGTALLSFDGSPPNLGDGWSLAAALASAGFILRLDKAARQGREQGGAPLDPAELNAATISASALLCSAWATGEAVLAPGGISGSAPLATASALAPYWAELLYLALATTALAQWLQAVGQSRVSGQDAAVVYALDPVYAAGFSYLLLGETLGPQGLAGAGLVLGAVAMSRGGKGTTADGAPSG
jgi:drug/metabolite transporter (DMT)-like permease